MNFRKHATRPFATALFGLALATASMHAAVTSVNDSNSTEAAFSPTSGDLLETSLASSTHSGWSTNNSANTVSLTDGVYGSVYVSGPVIVDGAWDQGGTPVSTYDLDVTVNTLGYDLTSIVSIAGWNGAGLGNQQFTVEVSTVGSADFTLLATGDNQLLGTAGGGTTIVTVQDDTVPGAVIASGVDAVRFTSLGTVGTNQWAVVREFDVNGTATVPEPSAVILLGLGGLAALRRRRH